MAQEGYNAPPPPYPGLSQNYSDPNDPKYYPPTGPCVAIPPPPGYCLPAGGPPPGYNQGQQSTVILAQPAVTTLIQTFREHPVHTRCPHCQAEIVTATRYESGTFTWVACFVMWLVGLGLGCCLIPFCIDGCKDVIHSCPSCQQQIARFNRMS